MKRLFAGGTGVTVALALGVVAFAQQPQQPPPTSSPSVQASSPQTTASEVTIAGCVQREADYRRAHNLGKGGAVGTGVGAGNEFVLVNASMSRAGSTPSTAPETAGTTGGAGEAYELTGSNEGKASEFVGKRVEVVGKLKPGETAAGGATGGPTAGTPPRGVDVASKDLKLRELDVTSIREATGGTCPTMENK